jgi:hypothetical protein
LVQVAVASQLNVNVGERSSVVTSADRWELVCRCQEMCICWEFRLVDKDFSLDKHDGEV